MPTSPPVWGIFRLGALVTPDDVDQAVLAQLRIWLPTYLKVLHDNRALDFDLPAPKTYASAIDQSQWLDLPLPAVIVQTADTAKVRGGQSQGQWSAQWNVTVNYIVRGPTPTQTRKLTSLCDGALRLCFLDKCRGNGTPLKAPGWVSTKIGEVPDDTDQGRYLAAGRAIYNVWTDAAAQSFGGPDVPNADVYVPTATVTEVNTDVEAKTD